MPFILRKTITETFAERVHRTPNAVGFCRKEGEEWREITFRRFFEDCRILSFGLMNLKVGRAEGADAVSGSKVAILSKTRYEWPLIDMAILGARGITVPVYPSGTAQDVEYILNHSDSEVVFVEDEAQLRKVLSSRERLPKLRRVIVISAGEQAAKEHKGYVLTMDDLRERGRQEEPREPYRFEKHLRLANPNDVLTICYTSGTTGVPKGVILTHDNMMSSIEDAAKVLGEYVTPEKEVLLSFLPFSHIIGKVESMATYVFGWRECHAESMEKVSENLREVRPTLLFSVPRVFEKARAAIQAGVDAAPVRKRLLYAWAVDCGRRYFTAVWNRQRPALRDFAEYTAARNLAFRPIHQHFGGRLRIAICGGAPLAAELGQYFQIIGIDILEGYGLTETCAPVAFNTPTALRFGSVGRPLPDVSIKVDQDGELLIKSRKVFKGYYKMPEETAAVFEGDWFRTGDIGHLDSDGFLHITDRKKDIIVTSAGKNIAPQKIENMAASLPFVHQLVVLGDQHNYLVAFVTLDREKVIQYANQSQILFSEYSELIKHPKIQLLAQKQIDHLNSQLASYETIKRFMVLPRDFTVESGEITPSLKVRRGIIADRYRSELESMYAS